MSKKTQGLLVALIAGFLISASLAITIPAQAATLANQYDGPCKNAVYELYGPKGYLGYVVVTCHDHSVEVYVHVKAGWLVENVGQNNWGADNDSELSYSTWFYPNPYETLAFEESATQHDYISTLQLNDAGYAECSGQVSCSFVQN